jgi:hypothetical protein
MTTIWDIKLFLLNGGKWRVRIRGQGQYAEADGLSPASAYRSATAKLVVKPFLEVAKACK